MEIYQAAQQYPHHLDILQSAPPESVEVWRICPLDEGGYMLMMNMSVLTRLPGYTPGSRFDGEHGFITKQRGGTRIFKTLEACLNALWQIGQVHVTVPTNITHRFDGH